MKPSVLAALLVLFAISFAHAAEKPLVRVQITYLDTPGGNDAMRDLLPPDKHTTGDALAACIRIVKQAHILSKVTIGPEVTTPVGVRATLDEGHLVTATSVGKKGAAYFVGAHLMLTPNVTKGDLVTIALKIIDLEIVGPAGYWFKQAEFGSADAPPFFKARVGSTILLSGCYTSPNFERFTFATVTMVPAKYYVDARHTHSQPYLRQGGPDHPPAFRMFPKLNVEITDADVSANITDDLTDAMLDRIHRKERLLVMSQEAARENHTFVLTPGIQDFITPSTRHDLFPSAGDTSPPEHSIEQTLLAPLDNYSFDQTLSVDTHPNPDGTATVHYELTEHPSAEQDSVPNSDAHGLNLDIGNTVTFHSGDTIVVSLSPRGSGIQHCVFLTVFIHTSGRDYVDPVWDNSTLLSTMPPSVKE